MKERGLYELVKKFLEDKFRAKFRNGYLEITSDGRFSEDLKSQFDDDVLLFSKSHNFPDLTGYVFENYSGKENENLKKSIIVVEVKNKKVTMLDICQAKLYAEFFGAKFSFLVSSVPIPEEIKRVLRMKPNILIGGIGYAYEPIFLGYFIKDLAKIRDYEWFPENPFERSS